ncbi:PREDICTED: trypsin theta-like [Rhagoletis zephyria]|uniref:trypsin theta-like n=1 Tax=Rhagoletis zephyria TaxID=28612 RepID=UPI00081132B9|nr:PREDICTED: trypsin theta-like [Rhagoletis zephyria]
MANQLVYGLLLLTTATAASAAAGIEGGAPANISDRSYLISFHDENGVPVCAGALIKKNIAVTAASCFAFHNGWKFAVGVHNGAKFLKVSDYTFSARFGYNTWDNDIAVLRLTESVEANYLTLASQPRPTGTSAVLTGWDANNTVVDVDETIISTKDCISGKYKYQVGEVFDSMLCGLAKDAACGALPGSPLVSGNKLIGLASWGNGCGDKCKPGVFTNIESFNSWIQNLQNKLFAGKI